MVLGEFGVALRPTESADYIEQLGENNDGSDDNKDNDTSSQARLVIIATAITGALLIIVVAAILCKQNKRNLLTLLKKNYNNQFENYSRFNSKFTKKERESYTKWFNEICTHFFKSELQWCRW